MIEIKFEAANGADLRKEMFDLLGIDKDYKVVSFPVNVSVSEKQFEDIKSSMPETKVEPEPTASEPTAPEAAKPEQTTRKRRTKAEIEAEAALAANTGTEEPPAAAENVDAATDAFVEAINPTKEEVTEPAVTAEDLTKKCVELGRAGKRDAVLGVFESQFGGATISKKDGKPQLTADQYPAVMDALNAL